MPVRRLPAAMFLASIVLVVGRASATINSTHYADGASNIVVETAFSEVPETNEALAATSTWRLQALDEAKGFAETAAAFDPNPIRHAGSDDRAAEDASLTPQETRNRAKVPEPPALILFGTVLIGIAHAVRKRSKA